MVVTFLGISVVVVVLTASAYLTSAVVTRALISFFFSVMNVSGVVDVVGVSVLELGTGLACRRLLHVEVWDYSQEWGNLAGLVCPKYTALWFLLCLWVLGMMRFLRSFAAYVARTKA